MASRKEIRDFYGKILGYVDDNGGEKTARTFTGEVLGYYRPGEDQTRNFYGQVICTGDATVGLILIRAGVKF